MAVLVYLANAGGAVVTRNELLDAVWPRMEVTQDALSQCIVELRKAFGDRSKRSSVIETIPKVGIRLIAPIGSAESSGRPDLATDGRAQGQGMLEERIGDVRPGMATDARRSKWGWSSAALVAVIGIALVGAVHWLSERERSIAVLPFTFESAANEDVEFFANGLHDELIQQLAKISAFDKVIGSTSVMRYRDTQKSIRQIGTELDVATILEGSVQRAGDAVRILVRLVDARTGGTIWRSEPYKRALTTESLFTLEGELAVSIADALEAVITDEELARLREVPTKSARAFDFYQRANEYFKRSINRREELPLALQLYKQAVAEDSEFAEAWARLGVVHTAFYFFDLDRTPERLDKAEKAIDKAFDLAPGLAEAHLARANYFYRGLNEYDEALREFAIAETLAPNDSDLYFFRASLYRRLGRWRESIEDDNKAIKIEPHNILYSTQQHVTYLGLRDYAHAEANLDRILELYPDDATTYMNKAVIGLYRDGDTALIHEYERTPPTVHYSDAFSYAYMRWVAAIYDRDYTRALSLLDAAAGDSIFERVSRRPKALYYARTYRLAGHEAQARARYRAVAAKTNKQIAGAAQQDPNLIMLLAEAQAGLGQKQQALASLARASDLPPMSPRTRDDDLRAVFYILSPLEERDEAFKELEDYLSGFGVWSIGALSKDPRLDALRDDPRFAALVKEYSVVSIPGSKSRAD